MRKRVLKWIIGILLTPVVLFIVTGILIYLPPVQDFAVSKAAVFMSEATGMDVHVGRLRITFLLDIDLQDVQIKDEAQDTLLDVESLTVDLDFSSLFQGEIDVEGIELLNATANTKDMIEGVEIKASLGRFFIDSHGIDLTQELVTVDKALLSDAMVDIALNDSTSEDTTTSESSVNWKIELRQVELTHTNLTFSMPGDSMRVAAGIAKAGLYNGLVDLGTSVYTVSQFDVQADSLFYDIPYEEAVEGLDVNHIALRDISLGVDSIWFDGNAIALSLLLREGALKEKCGLEVSSLTGQFSMDSTSLHLPELELRTPDSYVSARASMDFMAFDEHPDGSFSARLLGELGKQDVMLFAGGMPSGFVRAYPNAPLVVRLSADGNMDAIDLTTLEARLPGAFELKADGQLGQLADSTRMSADVNLALRTYDLDFVKGIVEDGSLDSIALPPMCLDGSVGMKGQQYKADLVLKEGEGEVRVDGAFDAVRMAYQANLAVDNLQLHDFLPQDSLFGLTVSAEAEGVGTDVFSRRTRIEANMSLDSLQYGSLQVSGVTLAASLSDGNGNITLDCDNPLAKLSAVIGAQLSQERTDATIDLDLRDADLLALGVTDKPLNVVARLNVEGSSNLKDAHRVSGTMTGMSLVLRDTVFHPKDMALDVLALPDSTYAHVAAGDLLVHFRGSAGYEVLLEKLDAFTTEADRQMQQRHLDQDGLVSLLPEMSVTVESGRHNPVANYMAAMGYTFDELKFGLKASPDDGLNGGAHIYTINADGIQLDTILMHISQDSTGVKIDGRVRNGPKNKQFVFDSRVEAYIHEKGAGINFMYFDDKGQTGVDFGLRADMTDSGIKVVLPQTHPIVAYRKFDINEDNYIFLGDDQHVEADVSMLADDGTGLKIYSTPNATALQDLTLELHQVNLGELTSVIPYAPRITGYLQTDAHLIQTEENLSVVADVWVDDMAYEEATLGNIGLGLVYLPNSDGTHFVDARVSHEEEEVMALVGAYRDTDGTGRIRAGLKLSSFPLSMANGFIPDQMAALEGVADGIMTVEGALDDPKIRGWCATRNMKIVSSEYSLDLSLEDDTIKVENNCLNLDKLNLYSTGKNPLVFDGTVDFADFDNIKINLTVNARDYELINAKRTQQATAYGKVNVDVNMRVVGNLNDLYVNGQLGVLGGTDVTYVLKDSPLSEEDRLSGLVTFVDFSDTTEVAMQETAQSMNLNMMLKLSINESAQVHCLLSADRSSYVDLEGGGDLTMIYTPQGEITLTGRYTVTNGEMKYSLPVIPLKTFTITSGSYIDFNGPMLNPTLNISATERVRATVTENNSPRSVSFDVGLSITQTLENMGLEFTISAPEDMTIQNQLATMSTEERGKVAVTMLATGMYLGSGSEGEGFSTSNALNALLQNEISNIAGKALETIDLSFGIDQSTTAEGTDRTDYSFRFAKRFWGNRISIIIGGKVSTGENVDTGESLIDNVSLEYRLDKSATRYVTLFYDRSYESLLEGEITEMGAGLVLRRKVSKLGDLFIFRNKSKADTSDEGSKGPQEEKEKE